MLPQVPPDRWTLQIGGMVGRELELTFADLLRLPLTEADITLVSSPTRLAARTPATRGGSASACAPCSAKPARGGAPTRC